jgi:hypothetical protein
MKSFEECLREQHAVGVMEWANQTDKRILRQVTREQRKKQRMNIFALAVIVWFVSVCLIVAFCATRKSDVIVDTPKPQNAVQSVTEPNKDGLVCSYPEYETGYRSDVPLSGKEQGYLYAACEEAGIEYELALAVIRQETNFRNVVGDDGNSIGYMQIQPKWHKERMERLGVTDLMDAESNFRVGCDFLAELLDKYTLEEALTAYNSGKAGQSAYAKSVMGYMEEYNG